MLVDRDTLTEFLRHVYDDGGATEADRQAYISTWRQAALDAIRDGGNVTSTSSNSASVGFSVPSGWTPQHVMQLAATARDYVSEATITAALAEVPARSRRHGTNITNLRVC